MSKLDEIINRFNKAISEALKRAVAKDTAIPILRLFLTKKTIKGGDKKRPGAEFIRDLSQIPFKDSDKKFANKLSIVFRNIEKEMFKKTDDAKEKSIDWRELKVDVNEYERVCASTSVAITKFYVNKDMQTYAKNNDVFLKLIKKLGKCQVQIKALGKKEKLESYKNIKEYDNQIQYDGEGNTGKTIRKQIHENTMNILNIKQSEFNNSILSKNRDKLNVLIDSIGELLKYTVGSNGTGFARQIEKIANIIKIEPNLTKVKQLIFAANFFELLKNYETPTRDPFRKIAYTKLKNKIERLFDKYTKCKELIDSYKKSIDDDINRINKLNKFDKLLTGEDNEKGNTLLVQLETYLKRILTGGKNIHIIKNGKYTDKLVKGLDYTTNTPLQDLLKNTSSFVNNKELLTKIFNECHNKSKLMIEQAYMLKRISPDQQTKLLNKINSLFQITSSKVLNKKIEKHRVTIGSNITKQSIKQLN